MTVHICPVKDIECGGHKVGWCAGCPKHGPKAADRIEALTAENARLKAELEAETHCGDEARVMVDRLREELERWKARYEEVSKCD